MARFFTKQDSETAAPPPPGANGGAPAADAPPGQSPNECMKAGQLLAEKGSLTDAQVAQALKEGNGDLLRFAKAVLQAGASRAEVAEVVGAVFSLPAADVRSLVPQEDAVACVDERLTREHLVLPITLDEGVLTIVAADPSPHRRQAIEAGAGQRVRWVVSDPVTVLSLIERMHRADADIDRLVQSFASTDAQKLAVQAAAAAEAEDQNDNAPVVQLVNRIVAQAMRDRTSDVHIEPLDDRVRVRFRIDGALVEVFSLPPAVHNAAISRLKILSGMNIVERRRPQDGQFSMTIDGRDLDVRVASVNTVFGEKIVLRLLDKSKSMKGLGDLGMPPDTYDTFAKMAHAPFGMIICAGPTGAGKTTTLYATLLEVNEDGKNVTTIEDPVEYVFAGINQIQTNEGAGVSFANGLKALMRQDPDVILVGEVRDADTCRIAVQAALTGHLVLSSLHGTDSVAALHRMLDMGIESFLIASAVVGVVGQRLLRRICDSCKEPYSPSPADVAFYERHGGAPKTEFWHGAGCSYCAGTGYRDRIGVYELLRITPELRRLIVGWATTEELRRLAVAQGMRTMLQEALSLVESDITTIPEVIRTLYTA
jgi:type IV pilus assembly protein PilB